MAVLPEEMQRLDTQDVRGSLLTIERYIRYMRERLEFAMSSAPARLSAAARYGVAAQKRAGGDGPALTGPGAAGDADAGGMEETPI